VILTFVLPSRPGVVYAIPRPNSVCEFVRRPDPSSGTFFMTSAGEITALLQRWSAGDRTAFDELLPLVYGDLHRIARDRMRHERPDHTLQTSALIHEAWLRMRRQDPVSWADRGHFYRLTARVMKQILIDYARGRASCKRGGPMAAVPLAEADLLDDARLDAALEIVAALDRLAELDHRKADVFEMRFFGGFDVIDTAQSLGVSKNTVVRDWDFACAWLRRELSRGASSGPA